MPQPDPTNTQLETYNYSVFEAKEDFVGFRSILKAGIPAPDFSVKLLETGEQVQLSDYWRELERITTFYAEFAGFRKNDPEAFQECLKVAGQQAVDDFARMIEF